MRDFLDRHTSLLAWLGGLGVPVALVFAGWLITTTTETSKLESEYVKIAVGILAAQPKSSDGKPVPLSEDELVLRQWAVRLLNKQSPEKFTKEEQKALLSVRQPLGDLSASQLIGLGIAAMLVEAAQPKQPEPAASGSAVRK